MCLCAPSHVLHNIYDTHLTGEGAPLAGELVSDEAHASGCVPVRACRVVEQLIEARVAQQNFSSQLATKAAKIQQLECDRALASQKLCQSEEKLVALEAQLGSLEAQLQERQEGLAAQGAALDVAALAAGPLAGGSWVAANTCASVLGSGLMCLLEFAYVCVRHGLGRWLKTHLTPRRCAHIPGPVHMCLQV